MSPTLQINPYLHFDGNCDEAFAFYAKVLGGTISLKKTYADMPMPGLPPSFETKILHVTLNVGSAILQGSDVPPERYVAPAGFTISLALDDVARADTLFDALAAGGTVEMPMQETPWSARFGMFVDRFGVSWMINVDRPA